MLTIFNVLVAIYILAGSDNEILVRLENKVDSIDKDVKDIKNVQQQSEQQISSVSGTRFKRFTVLIILKQ